MKTDWNNVASWYDEYLQGEDTYQAKVIAPNLMRLLDPKKGMTFIDVACGQGYFSKFVAQSGARVIGIDQAKELLEVAYATALANEGYMYGDAQQLEKLNLEKGDVVYSVLALENIQDIKAMMTGIGSLLKPDGRVVLVLLHPAFRIPKHSDWGYSSEKKMQYRTVHKYLSELSIPIELRPFKGSKESTVTFHRSLQWYMKAFRNAGFAITNIEEWISHKSSEAGPRKQAEDVARKEFPLFMAIELKKTT